MAFEKNSMDPATGNTVYEGSWLIFPLQTTWEQVWNVVNVTLSLTLERYPWPS